MYQRQGQLDTLQLRRRRSISRQTVAPANTQLVSLAADMAAFLIGLTGFLVVKVGGDLPIAEVLVLLLLPFVIVPMRHRLASRRFRRLFLLVLIGLCSQAVTDIYRHSALLDWLRLDVRYVFFALDLVVLSTLLRGNQRRQVVFFVGYSFGQLLQGLFQPAADVDPWKWRYSHPLTVAALLMCVYAYKRRNYVPLILTTFCVMGIDIVENFRTPILLLMISLALSLPLLPSSTTSKLLPREGSVGRVIFLLVIAASAGLIAEKTVSIATSAGLIGEQARLKNESQSHARGGMLLGGRPEIFISSRAVMDSPILGHGAFAKDPKYMEMYQMMRAENGLDEKEKATDRDIIPTHSHIMGAWVDGGILTAPFWLYVLYLVGTGIIRYATIKPAFAPLMIFLLAEFLWSIWFSPAGGITILPEAFLLTVLVDFLDNRPAAKRITAPGRPELRMRRRLSGALGHSVAH